MKFYFWSVKFCLYVIVFCIFYIVEYVMCMLLDNDGVCVEYVMGILEALILYVALEEVDLLDIWTISSIV